MPCGELGVDFFLIIGLCGIIGGMTSYLISDKLKKRQLPRKTHDWNGGYNGGN